METLHTIRKWLDKIVGTICIFLFALMVVVGSYQIITRFIFNNPSTISNTFLCAGASLSTTNVILMWSLFPNT